MKSVQPPRSQRSSSMAISDSPISTIWSTSSMSSARSRAQRGCTSSQACSPSSQRARTSAAERRPPAALGLPPAESAGRFLECFLGVKFELPSGAGGRKGPSFYPSLARPPSAAQPILGVRVRLAGCAAIVSIRVYKEMVCAARLCDRRNSPEGKNGQNRLTNHPQGLTLNFM